MEIMAGTEFEYLFKKILMKQQNIFMRLFVTSCIIYGMMLAGCQSNDYDNSIDPPATSVSPAHGDVLVPDSGLTKADVSMHDSTMMHSTDSIDRKSVV